MINFDKKNLSKILKYTNVKKNLKHFIILLKIIINTAFLRIHITRKD